MSSHVVNLDVCVFMKSMRPNAARSSKDVSSLREFSIINPPTDSCVSVYQIFRVNLHKSDYFQFLPCYWGEGGVSVTTVEVNGEDDCCFCTFLMVLFNIYPFISLVIDHPSIHVSLHPALSPSSLPFHPSILSSHSHCEQKLTTTPLRHPCLKFSS